jgi:hypothetical protein
MSRITSSLLSILLLSSATSIGCVSVVVPTNTAAVAVNKPPVIAAFDYSPKAGVGKSDFVTFTLVVSDPENQALTYSWTSTKGLLTANTGATVAWRPAKADSTFEAGLSQVTVVVSDGQNAVTATANILINEKGEAAIQDTSVPPATPSAAPALPSPVPSVALPSASVPLPSASVPVPSASVPQPAPSTPATTVPGEGVSHTGILSTNRGYTVTMPASWTVVSTSDMSGTARVAGKVVAFRLLSAAPVPLVDGLTQEDLKRVASPAGSPMSDHFANRFALRISDYPALKVSGMYVNINAYFYSTYYLIGAPEALYVLECTMKAEGFDPINGTGALADYAETEKVALDALLGSIVSSLQLK